MRRNFVLIPNLGILLSVSLYFYAATLYPGGQAFNKAALGYSHINNFWCDLFDQVTYSGLVNPARPYVLLATLILPISLVFFWLSIPKLFKINKYISYFVQVCGCLAMLFMSLIFTKFHNNVLNYAALFGFAALLTTQIALFKSGERKLMIISTLSILLLLANFLMWRAEFELPLMARVQKCAFLSFFIWVWVASIKIHKKSNSLTS